MDSSEYKKEFVSEAKDHMDTLNEGLLQLEKDANDEENINKIFRAFHTLKGNSAAMGYIKFSELAHALEDVLSKVRDKELKVAQEVMDLLFDGCDILEEGLDKITNDNPDDIEVETSIADLKNMIGAKEEVFEIDIPEKLVFSKDEKKKVAQYKKKKFNIYRILLVFDPKNFLKSGKASVVLRELVNDSELVKSIPVSDDIKQGKFGADIEIVVASKKKKEDIQKVIDGVSGFKQNFILKPDEKYVRPKIEDLVETKTPAATSEAPAGEEKKEVVKEIKSVRVEMGKLDKLMNLVGELLVSNIRLQSINKRHNIGELKTVLAGIDRLSLDLQDEVMGIRMIPIGNIFNRFPRMVRDLASKQSKKLNLVVEGSEIEFDRTVLDEIGDPLVHLLRNSVDHGVELPEERQNAGKEEQGIVKLIARREKNHAVVEVMDDGAGIDPAVIKESSVRKGHITQEEADRMSDNDLQMLIFRPGVSSNKVVTEVSGRGVGMDVVLSKIKQLGGTVKLVSEIGKGSTVTMKLPLTVAIITALMVKVGDEMYAIPLTNVDETVDVQIDDIKMINNSQVFIRRGLDIPIFWLHDLTGMKDYEKKKNLTVVIVNYGDENIGFVVDLIESQQQILIKSLPDVVRGTAGFSGATILGDGSVALIVDINSLLDTAIE